MNSISNPPPFSTSNHISYLPAYPSISAETGQKVIRKIACLILGGGLFFLSLKMVSHSSERNFNYSTSFSCPETVVTQNAFLLFLKDIAPFFLF